MKTTRLTNTLGALCLLALPSIAQADDFSWNDNGGLWSDPNHWDQSPGSGGTPGATDDIVTPTNNGFIQVDPASVSVMDWTYSNTGSHLVVANDGATTINVLGTMTLSNGNFTSRNSGTTSLTTWDVNHLDVTGSTSNGHQLGIGNGNSDNWIQGFTTDTMNVSAGRVSFRVLATGGTATVTDTLTMSGSGEVGIHWSQAANENGTLAVGGLTSASASNIIQVHHGSTGNEGLLQLNNGIGVSTTYAGILRDGVGGNSNTMSVEKNNAGTQEFSGTSNAYSGTTAVNGGTLLISGVHTGGDTYTVTAGGTLAGTNGETFGAGVGNINTADDAGISFQSGGMLAMGPNPGEVGIFSANLGAGVMDISGAVGGANTGSLLFDLAAIGASDQFQLFAGTLAIGNGELEFADFDFTALAGIQEGDYTLFDTSENINGTLGADLTGIFGNTWQGTLSIQNNQDIVLSVALVPEPTSAALLLGAAGLLAFRRRRS